MLPPHRLRHLSRPDFGRVVAAFLDIQHRMDRHLIGVGGDIIFIGPDPAIGQAIGGGKALVGRRDHRRLHHRMDDEAAPDHLLIPGPFARRRDERAMHDDGIATRPHIGLEPGALRRVQFLARRVEEHHRRILAEIAVEDGRVVGPGEAEIMQLAQMLQAVARDRYIFIMIFVRDGEDEQLILVLRLHRCGHRQRHQGDERPGLVSHPPVSFARLSLGQAATER